MDTAYVVKVTGRVQGVGFRYYTKLEADRLGLTGTVENKSDGTVHIYVVGEKSIVQDFIKWCHTGPATALVEQLEYHLSDKRKCRSFEILR